MQSRIQIMYNRTSHQTLLRVKKWRVNHNHHHPHNPPPRWFLRRYHATPLQSLSSLSLPSTSTCTRWQETKANPNPNPKRSFSPTSIHTSTVIIPSTTSLTTEGTTATDSIVVSPTRMTSSSSSATSLSPRPRAAASSNLLLSDGHAHSHGHGHGHGDSNVNIAELIQALQNVWHVRQALFHKQQQQQQQRERRPTLQKQQQQQQQHLHVNNNNTTSTSHIENNKVSQNNENTNNIHYDIRSLDQAIQKRNVPLSIQIYSHLYEHNKDEDENDEDENDEDADATSIRTHPPSIGMQWHVCSKFIDLLTRPDISTIATVSKKTRNRSRQHASNKIAHHNHSDSHAIPIDGSVILRYTIMAFRRYLHLTMERQRTFHGTDANANANANMWRVLHRIIRSISRTLPNTISNRELVSCLDDFISLLFPFVTDSNVDAHRGDHGSDEQEDDDADDIDSISISMQLPDSVQHEVLPKLMQSLLSIQKKFDVHRNILGLWWLGRKKRFPLGGDGTGISRNWEQESDNDGMDGGVGGGGGNDDETTRRRLAEAYQSVLECSTYRRQQDVPFALFLDALVQDGAKPPPEVVLNILQNEYPFTNVHHVKKILNCIIHLQREQQQKQQQGDVPSKPPLQYRVDMGTLEAISASAGRKGSPDMIILLWDYMDLMTTSRNHDSDYEYYQPTEGMYEDAIQAFCIKHKSDHLALDVLAEMEERGGYVPHRSLLKTMSRSMRSSIRRLENAHRLLTHGNRRAAGRVTTSSLNCILSAYAELGRVDRAWEVYLDDFDRFGCEPNGDTASFLMEAISQWSTNSVPFGADVSCFEDGMAVQRQKWLDAADAVLELKEERNWPWTHHLAHHYVQVLCAAGELDAAKQFLLDSGRGDEGKGRRISLDTYSLVANSFARLGRLEDADSVVEICRDAGYVDGLPSYVMKRIDRLKVLAERNDRRGG